MTQGAGQPRGEPGAKPPGLATSVPIVLLASACWQTHTPVNVHQIARRFAARGHRVLFVESTGLRGPRLRSPHDVRRIRQRLAHWPAGARRAGENLWVLAPLALPLSWPKLLRAVSLKWVGRAVRRAVASLRMDRPILWAFLPTYVDVAASVPRRLLVYHCVDHFAANPGVDRPWIEQKERHMLLEADLVLATSPVLADRLRGLRESVTLLPNVADVELFGRAATDELPEPEDLRDLPRPRLVYVGNLAVYRIDLELLLGVTQRQPRAQLVIIGVIGHGDTESSAALRRLLEQPNVCLLGPKPQEALPGYLRHCDVALIPFLDNQHTRGSLPMKLWEYVAAGLPVVATDLPNFEALARCGTARTARGAEGFSEAITEALAEPASRRAGRLEAARGHGWDRRIDELRALLGEALQGDSPEA